MISGEGSGRKRKSMAIEKCRGQCVSGSYQNYQHRAVSYHLIEGGKGEEFVGGGKESI